jgi:hypothetical protein
MYIYSRACREIFAGVQESSFIFSIPTVRADCQAEYGRTEIEHRSVEHLDRFPSSSSLHAGSENSKRALGAKSRCMVANGREPRNRAAREDSPLQERAREISRETARGSRCPRPADILPAFERSRWTSFLQKLLECSLDVTGARSRLCAPGWPTPPSFLQRSRGVRAV